MLNTIKIESGNQLPTTRISKGSVYKEVFDKMEVGNNIYTADKALFKKLYNSAFVYGNKFDKTFSARKEIKNGEEVYGLWRVK